MIMMIMLIMIMIMRTVMYWKCLLAPSLMPVRKNWRGEPRLPLSQYVPVTSSSGAIPDNFQEIILFHLSPWSIRPPRAPVVCVLFHIGFEAFFVKLLQIATWGRCNSIDILEYSRRILSHLPSIYFHSNKGWPCEEHHISWQPVNVI